jgi:hypothetical protein
MWESRQLFGEISKGLVERVGSLLVAFQAFHSPGISTHYAAIAGAVTYDCPASFFRLLFFSR